MTTPGVLLEMRGVRKSFGHVEALRGVDLDLRRGEILGLVGDNGAGKSTLMKVLAGLHAPDAGEILIEGEPVKIGSIRRARELGIEMVYQDLALFEEAGIVANVFAGRELRKPFPLSWQLDHGRMKQETQSVVERLGITARADQYVGQLSGGQRQMVAIARSVTFSRKERVVIMDEPTAALGVTEAAAVDDVIKRLGGAGISIVYISHRIPQLLELADRILVLKGGRRVGVRDSGSTSVEELVNLIVAGEPEAVAA
jgi:simple sugar transport system ATP-binding protein